MSEMSYNTVSIYVFPILKQELLDKILQDLPAYLSSDSSPVLAT